MDRIFLLCEEARWFACFPWFEYSIARLWGLQNWDFLIISISYLMLYSYILYSRWRLGNADLVCLVSHLGPTFLLISHFFDLIDRQVFSSLYQFATCEVAQKVLWEGKGR